MKNRQEVTRHVPERTCVICRKKTTKRELVRLVCTPAGVEIDITGKKPGRGAYLCKGLVCWETAFKNERLERALRTSIKQGNRDQLMTYARELDKEGAS